MPSPRTEGLTPAERPAGMDEMDRLPVFFDVKGKSVLVVGGGMAAARRAETALRAGGRVSVAAFELGPEFHEIGRHARLTHLARAPAPEDFEGCVLVFAASGDAETDRRTKELANGAGVPVNLADQPDHCDFIMPSIVDRSPIVIAISTAGAAPILGRMIKARIETMIPAAAGRLAHFVGRFRPRVRRRLAGEAGGRRFWEKFLDGPIAELVLAGREAEAEAALGLEIEAAAQGKGETGRGEVYLVGAGPGDPDLLTFRALRLMQRADVVLYDRLVDEAVLNLVRREAERIYVGKLPNRHVVPQEDISRLLVKLAREGRRVLRLKGGDPFIFGRGGEEIEMLAEQGIPFQVVPGITAASGCATYAGIPLTHRDHAQACVFVTGHGKTGLPDIDWKAFLQQRQTIAIYMGLAQIDALMEQLIAAGADPGLPAAVIENGTRPRQRVVTGTVATLAAAVAEAGLRGPTIIIVGTVVTLRDKLNWYSSSEGGVAAYASRIADTGPATTQEAAET